MVQKNNIGIGVYEYGLLCLPIQLYAHQNGQLFS
jgi:hypothetical protein